MRESAAQANSELSSRHPYSFISCFKSVGKLFKQVK